MEKKILEPCNPLKNVKCIHRYYAQAAASTTE